MKRILTVMAICSLLLACSPSDTNQNDIESDQHAASDENTMPEKDSEQNEASLDPLNFDIVQEYGGGILALQNNMEGLGGGPVKDLFEVGLEGEGDRLGKIRVAGRGKVVFEAQTQTLYFLSFDDEASFESFSLYSFDFNTRDAQRIAIEPANGSDNNQIWDFTLTDNTIIYLEGNCQQGNECRLMSFDPETQSSDTLLENLPSDQTSGYTVDYFDPTTQNVVLSLAGNDQGRIFRQVYNVDLNVPELIEGEYYLYDISCDEESEMSDLENCTEENIASTKAFKTMRYDFVSLLCPNKDVTDQYKDDWEVVFVHCPV